MSSNSYNESRRSDQGNPSVWPLPAIEPPFSPGSIYDHSTPRSSFSGSTAAPLASRAHMPMNSNQSPYPPRSRTPQGYNQQVGAPPTMVSSPLARSASYSPVPPPLALPSTGRYQQPLHPVNNVPRPPGSVSSVSSGRTVPGTPGLERYMSLGYPASMHHPHPSPLGITAVLGSDPNRSTPLSDMTLVNQPPHFSPRGFAPQAPRSPYAPVGYSETSRSSPPSLGHLVNFGTPGVIQQSQSFPGLTRSLASGHQDQLSRSMSYDSNTNNYQQLASASHPSGTSTEVVSRPRTGAPGVAYLGTDVTGYPLTLQAANTTQTVDSPGTQSEIRPTYIDYQIHLPPGESIRLASGKKYTNATNGVVLINHHKKVPKDEDEEGDEEHEKKRKKGKRRKEVVIVPCGSPARP